MVAVFALPSLASFSRAIGSETYCRSPFGTSATRSAFSARRAANSASSRGSSGQRAARVQDSGEQELVEAAGHVVEMGRVEVDADRAHGQVGQAAPEQRACVAELEPEREIVAEPSERLREGVEIWALLAREERLRQDDELGLDALERGPEDAVRDLLRRQARALRERERRGERDEARPGERRDVAVAERLAEARPALAFGAR